MFADKVEIEIIAGKGGDGKLSFRHDRTVAKGGADGGDGGKGGDVVFEVDHNQNTLSRYRTNRRIKAEDGGGGGSNRRHGKSGEDVIIKVPAGTVVLEDGEVLADLTADGQTAVLAKGGRGGFGNAHFVSSTRQVPRVAELGEKGERKNVVMELKLVADVGLVGLPNAGKSTLLSVISNAKPEIADYPFTTLVPNLGVVDIDDSSFLVADIPGLIEGASQGKGLGDEFLRHIERTAVLLHLVDVHGDDVAGDWRKIQQELKDYGHGLEDKPQLAVLTKTEGMDAKDVSAKTAELKKVSKLPVFAISSSAHKGLDELLRAAAPLVQAARQKRAEEAEVAEVPVIDSLPQVEAWQVESDENGTFTVTGSPRLEGFANRTNWSNPEAVARMRDIMRKTGVARELRRQGAKGGDKVRIGEHQLEWLE